MVQLNWSLFVIHNKALNFHDLVLHYHGPFCDDVKNTRKISVDFYRRNYNHVRCITRDYVNNNYVLTL